VQKYNIYVSQLMPDAEATDMECQAGRGNSSRQKTISNDTYIHTLRPIDNFVNKSSLLPYIRWDH